MTARARGPGTGPVNAGRSGRTCSRVLPMANSCSVCVGFTCALFRRAPLGGAVEELVGAEEAWARKGRCAPHTPILHRPGFSCQMEVFIRSDANPLQWQRSYRLAWCLHQYRCRVGLLACLFVFGGGNNMRKWLYITPLILL